MPATQPEASARNEVLAVRSELTDWYLRHALPLWWSIGTDHANGGFFEKIGRSGDVIDEPRRTRVVGRQIYCFAVAGRLGWTGPADTAVAHGIHYLHRCSLSTEGTAVFTTHPDGTVLDGRVDLYDQAFALFGLAAAFATTRDPVLATTAARLRDRLGEAWRHEGGGYEETIPRSLPLKANPHMHLFEAALDWEKALAGSDAAAGWAAMADDIGRLCLDRFIDKDTGCLREFFDGNWQPMAGATGRIVEPGHQFEWSWLLSSWGTRRALPEAMAASRRLLEIGEANGTDRTTELAINELWDDLSPKDSGYRLWPQTERLKAWVVAAETAQTPTERAVAFGKIAAAGRGVQKFLANDIPGTWNERLTKAGDIIIDASPASSLYHISGAINELWATPTLA